MAILKTGRPSNVSLRIFSCFLLLVTQCVLLSGGCGGNGGDGDGNGGDGNTPTATPTPGSDGNTPTPTPGGDGSVVLEDLQGWWAVQRANSPNDTTWGHAQASLTEEQDSQIEFVIDADEEMTGILTFHSSGEDQLSGTLVPGNSGGSENWDATVNAAGDTITATRHLATGDQTVTFHRAQEPDHTLTGMWTRATDDAPTVVAYDGESLLLSPLDAEGYWTEEERIYFVEEDFEGEQLVGVGAQASDHYTGLIFAKAARMLLRFSGDAGSAWIPFQRSSPQSDLNGRWVVGDRESPQTPTKRAVGVVVAYQDTLYVHEAYDGEAGLSRVLRAVKQGEQYVDDEVGWSGRLNAQGSRITGSWTGYPDCYHSMDRTARPATDALDGESRSLSVDWTEQPPNMLVSGTAQISQTGDRLQITDQSGDGRTYQVEAQWRGDHYEGTYFDTAEPGDVFPWRGEMLVGGWYIHGAWSRGEYSFLQAAVADTADSLTSSSTRTVALVFDPYQDLAATFNDPDAGTSVNVYRTQDRVSGFTYTTPDGTLQTVVDERLRPTRVTGLDHVMTVVWSEDSTTAEVTVEHDGESATFNLAIDLTDEGVLRAVDANEDRTGQDMTPWRNWIAQHPGLVLAVARGEQLAPSFDTGSAPAPSASKTWSGAKADERVVNSMMDRAVIATAVGTAIVGYVLFESILVGEAGIIASTGLTFALGAGLGVLGAAVVIAIAVLLYVWIEDCQGQPCSLRCFFNCI